MYKHFYQLRENPFSLLPDPAYLFLTNKHKRALNTLQYGILRNYGFVVITGEIGSGKTTLIRRLLNELTKEITVGLINNTHHSFSELLKWVFVAYGLSYRGKDTVELYEEFMNFIISEYASKRRVVLIIDEAQNMSAEALEELRMLSNINADKHQALQIVLVGQPELKTQLQQPELKQFAQRIVVANHLRALDKAEIKPYINHRVVIAGGKGEFFSDEAIDKIWHNSGGVPRLINSLCDACLFLGMISEQRLINVEIVEKVIMERRESGCFVGNM